MKEKRFERRRSHETGKAARARGEATLASSPNRPFRPVSPLESILAEVGEPRSAPFRPDPFQKEGLSRIAHSDVLVCAPTGSGKTWIAMEAIDRWSRGGGRAWYASPLKALSNAKYSEFQTRFGGHRVGILTGDRKENPRAPIIVGTTEILRNQLYDAMSQGRDLNVDLVVIDEAHYLNDPERGVVWEEVFIYLPPRVRILMLSATIGNPEQICRWLESIRGRPCELVEEKSRPVPLHPIFLAPDGRICLLTGRHGLHKTVREYLQEAKRARGRGRAAWRYEQMIEELGRLALLPAIFFLKSRADCDRAVESFFGGPCPADQRDALSEAVEPVLREHPIAGRHRHLPILLRYGIASHHAGHLPQWKLLIERLMKAGHLRAIFSTSTVAAGVDFPARAVVLIQSDRFNGRSFETLTSTELQQMTGRAGRRGMDKVGFALFVPGPYQDIPEIVRLLRAKPESLRSQIQIHFSMTLNLLLSHRPEEVRLLLQRSLAAFQRGSGNGAGPTAGQKRTAQEQPPPRRSGSRPRGAPPGRLDETEMWIARRIRPGRLFLHRDGSVHVVFHMRERRGRPLCMAHRLDRKVRVRKGKVVLKGVPIGQIACLMEGGVALPEKGDARSIQRALDGVKGSRVSALASFPSGTDQRAARGAPQRRDRRTGQSLWEDFLHHMDFLRDTGFVDCNGRLTEDGRWASRLRLDHPIVVAEAIRQGVFENRSAEVTAGLMAPFVTDREREVVLFDSALTGMRDAFETLFGATRQIRTELELRGFRTPMLAFWPAAILYLWTKGSSWQALKEKAPLDEGDLVSIIVRTADQLRQLCDLTEAHPEVAKSARLALQRIQREPAMP